MIEPQPQTDLDESDSSSASSSLIARAGQIMAIIITLGLLSMISSMLVSESLSGDAAQINRAGALRMQAVRVSRAYLIEDDTLVSKEIAIFEERLNHLFIGGITNSRDNPEIEAYYQRILVLWKQLLSSGIDKPAIESFDQFVFEVDALVTLFQQESEKKLEILRLIQGISLFSVVIVAFVVMIRLNRSIVAPLKQLVTVAEAAGKGNFDLKAEYDAQNELGVLARTINRMSDELETTYQDFEERVSQKTTELTQSNRSLQVLYRAASHLANVDERYSDQQIIEELEPVLGIGKVSIERKELRKDSLSIDISSSNNFNENFCFERLEFPLEKQQRVFGTLIWQIPKKELVREWHTQLLKALADIIATAMELDEKRNAENRLLIVEERAVIARELHDSLAQSLSYLKVQMSLLTRKMQKNVEEEQVNETIEDIKLGLNRAYLQLRELLTTFRLKLEDPSIENALQGTVAEFSAKCLYKIEFDFQMPQNFLSANQEIHLLQIVREALSNVHRHAEAEHAGISIKALTKQLTIKIWDDGKGISDELVEQGHFGIGIMQERAKSLGANLELKPRQPQGTIVVAEFVV